MTDNINLYCRLVYDGAEVSDPRLLKLRGRMTRPELDLLQARLRREADATFREANAPETRHALAKCGARFLRP